MGWNIYPEKSQSVCGGKAHFTLWLRSITKGWRKRTPPHKLTNQAYIIVQVDYQENKCGASKALQVSCLTASSAQSGHDVLVNPRDCRQLG